MALTGPVLVIDDDTNDAEVIEAAIRDLGVKNEVKRFASALLAIDYLFMTTDQPLIILSDIRMPGMDGLSLLKKIAETPYLREKAIPFVFLTGFATRQIVDTAYKIGVQGFYRKASSYVELKDQIFSIMAYWTRCLHPNTENLD
jgi:CheY-like chemotaxis protein